LFAEGAVQGVVAGIDEAGRGPLAGPVVAAAVAFAPAQKIAGVRDSKKLSAARREMLAAKIRDEALAWSLGIASVAEIDELNILEATMLAMRRAVASLPCEPARLHIDGNRCPDFAGVFAGAVETIVGGDDSRPEIGAASILAKVARDALMDELHAAYPAYGFDRHRGYPTAAHRHALNAYGPTPAHRLSFRPVRAAADRLRGRVTGGEC
jgi:ribonuclease HII